MFSGKCRAVRRLRGSYDVFTEKAGWTDDCAAAVGAAAYFLNRNEHTEEYEHIWGPEDEADAEDGTAETAEPADDASARGRRSPRCT